MHVDDYRNSMAQIEQVEAAVNEKIRWADTAPNEPAWPTILAAGMIARAILVLARVLLASAGMD